MLDNVSDVLLCVFKPAKSKKEQRVAKVDGKRAKSKWITERSPKEVPYKEYDPKRIKGGLTRKWRGSALYWSSLS